MTATVHRLDLREGVVLRIEDHGDPDDPVAMVLHGFTGDASTMAALAGPIAATRRVLVPDLMGHGGSSSPAVEDHSVDAMVDQLVGALDRFHVRAPVDLVGYSMGGRVALTLACRHPDRVRTLSLIGASAGLPTEEERTARIAADEELARFIEREGLDAFVDRWMANPLFATQARLGPAALARFRAQRMGNDPDGLARSLRAAGTGAMRPLHDELRRCAVPTTLIVGADDEKFTALAHDLAGLLPTAGVAMIAGAGHAAHLEQPASVVAAVQERMARPAVDILPTLLQLRSPLHTAAATTSLRETLLVRVTGSGATGWGEAAPLPGWSPAGIDDCVELLEDRALQDEVRTLAHVAGGGRDWWERADDLRAALDPVPPARAGVIGALLDLEARGRGLVLADLLAARFGDPALTPSADVAINGLLTANDPGALAEEARRIATAGVTVLKIKVGALAPERDVERVAAVRSAVPGSRLRIDANGAWDPTTARTVLEAMARFDLELCEEPTSGIEAIVEVGRHVVTPVAVDESARTHADLAEVWRHAEVVGAVVIKPQALGGADVALSAIAEARRHDVEVIVTTMIDSAVGVAHAAHVAAAAALPGPHGLDTGRLLAEDVARPLPVAAGRMWLRQHEAGLGIGTVTPPDDPGVATV